MALLVSNEQSLADRNPSAPVTHATDDSGTHTDMNKITIKRDGLPPIVFTGERIAVGSNRDHNSTRWTTVEIYRTQGERYIARIERCSLWEGERTRRTASSFPAPAELIEWLGEGEQALGEASQRAVEAAAAADPKFAAAWVEEVE